MDITLLPPSTILSQHSHLALLPSPFPNTPLKSGFGSSYDPPDRFDSTVRYTYPKVPYRLRKRYEAPAPTNGRSPISELPDEIMLSIFGLIDWEELVPLRTVSRQWAELALTPSLHSSLIISALPTPIPTVLRDHLLKSVRHLYLHLFPYPTHRSGRHPTAALLNLLEAIPPGQLRSLSLPFSAPYVSARDLGVALRHIGSHLQYLDLKGSGLVGTKWTGWLSDMGKDGPGLEYLDLGFTSISSLAIQGGLTVNPFRNVKRLSLASCTYLSESTLAGFLEDLPRTIEYLDLSRLDNVSLEGLMRMKVVEGDVEDGGGQEPTALKEVKVVGIDHLTRRDVRRLKAHWEDQRRACLPEDQRAQSPISVYPVRWNHKAPVQQPYRPLSPPASPHTPERVIRALSPSPPTPSHPFFEGLGRLPTPPRSTSPPDLERDDNEIADEYDRISVNIVHSAILESEDEEGYRQFIGEVAGASTVVGHGLGDIGYGNAQEGTAGLGLGLGAGLGLYVTSRGAGWVEVDGGGPM